MGKWFLVYCKPRQEIRAEENLLRQGFEVFRPTIQVVKSNIGVKGSVKREPLFPRYLFIKANPEVKSIGPVISTYGVSSFVKFGDSYAIASEALIEQIKIKVDTLALQTATESELKPGDRVYVDGCGFDHVEAIYQHTCGEKRSLILIDILGKESRVFVPKHHLSKKPSPTSETALVY